MPKKIKKESNMKKNNNEKFLNADNIHYIFIFIAILAVCICAIVGVYIYKEDKYHVHKDNALVQFVYTENTGDGFNVFSVTRANSNEIFLEYNTTEVQEVTEISEGKYLDLNEEVYNSGLIEQMNDEEIIGNDMKWNLYIEFADGTTKFLYSSNPDNPSEERNIDKSILSEIIKKYFGQEILYK